jgi:hypothetical protein
MSRHLKLVPNPTETEETEGKSADAHPLINPEDFKSITLKIGLLNMTTETEIRDGKRIFGIDAAKAKKNTASEDLSIHITEFHEKGLGLEVPAYVCAAGHNVVLTVNTEGAKPNVAFNASAKIDASEKLANKREVVQLTFTQFDEKAWRDLQEIYGKRQEQIFEFFKAVKE